MSAISGKVKEAMERASWIRRMFEEGLRLKQEHGEDAVCDLTLGNPMVEPPASFRKRLKEVVSASTPGMHRYMPNAGYPWVRERIAEHYRRETGLDFGAQHIIMTCGAAGALNVVLKSLLDPGDEVIIFAPYFPEYIFYIENHGGVPKIVPTNSDFSINLVQTEAALSERTKAVLVNSPNNPTGVLYGRYTFQALGDLLERYTSKSARPIYLINDGPYRKIVYDGREAPFVFEFYRNSIEVTSHSKDLAIPGERIGHIAISPEANGASDIANACTFANRTLGFVNAPALMQRVVAELQDVTVDISEYQAKRDLLYEQLYEMGYEVVKPEGAFYFFPRTPTDDDLKFVNELKKRLVLVVPGSGFGAPGHFRISYCVPKEVVEKALPAFNEVARLHEL